MKHPLNTVISVLREVFRNRILRARYRATASAPTADSRMALPGMDPASQGLRLLWAGVPRDHIHGDAGFSGTTGTQDRRG